MDPADQADVAVPDLLWVNCGGQLECSELEVPLNHFRPEATGPDGQTSWRLSLVRRPAAGEAVGSIVVNPGGPGASGVDFVTSGFSLGAAVAERYHVVGFDPRGIGASGSVMCDVDRRTGPLPDYDPDSASERTVLDEEAGQLAEDCLMSSATLLESLTSRQVAEDLELLRRALGTGPLNFVGLSYGTYLGATYARQHPDNVGRLILDGVVTPETTLNDLLVQQSAAFDAAAGRLDDACADGRQDRCPRDGFLDGFDQLLSSVDREPIGETGPTEVTMATLFALYSEDLWPTYLDALAAGLDGSGEPVERLSDFFLTAVDFVPYATYVCNDLEHPTSPDQWDDLVIEAERRSSRFGPTIANELRVCAHWADQLAADPPPETSTDDQWLSVPAVIVGTSGDAATPPENSEALHATMPNSTLVTVQAERHTSIGSSECLDAVVEQFILDGSTPAAEIECGT